jgi:hypothetical protein
MLAQPEVRQQCVNKGLERAKHFSWEKCAANTLQVLNELH